MATFASVFRFCLTEVGQYLQSLDMFPGLEIHQKCVCGQAPNPLAKFEGHFKAGKREGKGRKGEERKERDGRDRKNTPE